jgi:hypothetical protein
VKSSTFHVLVVLWIVALSVVVEVVLELLFTDSVRGAALLLEIDVFNDDAADFADTELVLIDVGMLDGFLVVFSLTTLCERFAVIIRRFTGGSFEPEESMDILLVLSAFSFSLLLVRCFEGVVLLTILIGSPNVVLRRFTLFNMGEPTSNVGSLFDTRSNSIQSAIFLEIHRNKSRFVLITTVPLCNTRKTKT